MNEVTRILNSIEHGQTKAADELLPLVYEELRRLAAQRMARENPGHTLQPTALVHEAWLRLAGEEHQRWDGRGHFFAAAAEAMRRILIEHARSKNAVKRGTDFERVNFESLDVAILAEGGEFLLVSLTPQFLLSAVGPLTGGRAPELRPRMAFRDDLVRALLLRVALAGHA